MNFRCQSLAMRSAPAVCKSLLTFTTLAALCHQASASVSTNLVAAETFGDNQGGDIGFTASPTLFDDGSTDFLRFFRIMGLALLRLRMAKILCLR